MESGAGSVGSHGGNGACRGGRRDAGAGSSTRSLFVPICSGGGDGGDRAWLVFLQLSKNLAPSTSNLCAAEMALRVANAAVLASEEGAGVRCTHRGQGGVRRHVRRVQGGVRALHPQALSSRRLRPPPIGLSSFMLVCNENNVVAWMMNSDVLR